MNPEKITRVLDTGLTGYSFTSQDQRTVFNKLSAPKKSPFRLRPALILALVLALALSAIAVANNFKIKEAAQQVVETEQQTAFLLSWTDSDKLTFLRMMREYGIEFPEGDGAIHRESWWTPYNALNDAMEIALGDNRFLTLEQQLFRQQVFEKCGLLQKGDPMVIMPTDKDLTQEQAFEMVKTQLIQAYGQTEALLNQYAVVVQHTASHQGTDVSWYFTFFQDRTSTEELYYCLVSESTKAVEIYDLSVKQTDEEILEALRSNTLPQYDHSIRPKDTDITAEEAEKRSRQAIKEAYPLTEEYLSSLYLADTAFYSVDGLPVWGISLREPTNDGHDKRFYVTINAATGDVVEIWDPNMGWG